MWGKTQRNSKKCMGVWYNEEDQRLTGYQDREKKDKELYQRRGQNAMPFAKI